MTTPPDFANVNAVVTPGEPFWVLVAGPGAHPTHKQQQWGSTGVEYPANVEVCAYVPRKALLVTSWGEAILQLAHDDVADDKGYTGTYYLWRETSISPVATTLRPDVCVRFIGVLPAVQTAGAGYREIDVKGPNDTAYKRVMLHPLKEAFDALRTPIPPEFPLVYAEVEARDARRASNAGDYEGVLRLMEALATKQGRDPSQPPAFCAVCKTFWANRRTGAGRNSLFLHLCLPGHVASEMGLDADAFTALSNLVQKGIDLTKTYTPRKVEALKELVEGLRVQAKMARHSQNGQQVSALEAVLESSASAQVLLEELDQTDLLAEVVTLRSAVTKDLHKAVGL